MAKSKSNTGFRNDLLFCFNCGASYDMHLPQPVSMASAMMATFDKTHKHCKKTWTEPVPAPEGKTVEENATWWLQNGERGMSSETMFFWLNVTNIPSPLKKPSGASPSDPGDFSRCYKLLQAVPQWKGELHRLKPVSPTWAALVDNWDKLTSMYEEEVQTKKDNGMYEFMEEIRCD